jgi:IPT/TIG domain
VLSGITLTTVPSGYREGYFQLVDDSVTPSRVLFNEELSTSAVSAGSVLQSGSPGYSFTNLVLADIPPGAGLDIVVTSPVFALTSLSPNAAVAGAANLTMTCTGTGFNPQTIITFDGTDLKITYVSTTSLTATVDVANASAGAVDVTVHDEGLVSTPAVAFTFT